MRYAAVTGSLAAQPFDMFYEYAPGRNVAECPSRFVSARVRDEPSYIMRAVLILLKGNLCWSCEDRRDDV